MGEMQVGPWERGYGINDAKKFPPIGENPDHLEQVTDLALPRMPIWRGKAYDLESHITDVKNQKLASKTQRVVFNEFVKSAPAA